MGEQQPGTDRFDADRSETAPPETILVRLSGPDQPGITAGLMTVLADAGAGMHDVEQVLIRGQLFLSIVISVPPDHNVMKDLLLYGWENNVEVDFEIVSDPAADRVPGLVVTLIGRQVSPAEFGAVATVLAEHGGNIDRIVRLARYPVMAYELLTSGPNLAGMRRGLIKVADTLPCDIAVNREGLGRRAARLIVLDVDSTLIRDEVIELMADEAGCREDVERITERAMAGELDFTQSLLARVELLAGLDAAVLDRTYDRIQLTPGARTFVRTLQRLGFRTAIVSGGFTHLVQRLATDLGIDHAHANTLEILDGELTGRIIGDVVDREGKEALLRKIAATEGIPLDQTVAVGDGANDLDMLNTAGFGIAFNAKSIVQDSVETTLNVPFLDAILFVLGVRRGDIEAADQEDETFDTTGPLPDPSGA